MLIDSISFHAVSPKGLPCHIDMIFHEQHVINIVSLKNVTTPHYCLCTYSWHVLQRTGKRDSRISTLFLNRRGTHRSIYKRSRNGHGAVFHVFVHLELLVSWPRIDMYTDMSMHATEAPLLCSRERSTPTSPNHKPNSSFNPYYSLDPGRC